MTAQVTDLERAFALLVTEHKLMPPEKAWAVIQRSRSGNEPILAAILDIVPDHVVMKSLADALGIRYYDLYATVADYVFDATVLERADQDVLRQFSALPLLDKNGRIVVAVANPNDPELIDYLRARYGQFQLVLSTKTQIQNRLAYYATEVTSLGGNAGNQQQQQSPGFATPGLSATLTAARSPMQEWLESILGRAVSEGASDVHFMFNPDKSMLMRFRVDGILRQQRVPANIRPIEIIGAIMSRCGMDMANLREPQDGTFTFSAAGRDIDGRVAMLPQEHGPTLVVRLLDSQNMRTRLDDMGFAPTHMTALRAASHRAQGMLIVCGPTGAGKSTTLYGLVREQDSMSKAVFTVENPVEYRLPYIGQTEIRHGLGDRSLTFARALRSILRLDPDVILVGEIRDQETAEVALQAALTGHLVLTTLHANSSISAYGRLVNMGLPRYLVSEAATLVASQRLVRRLHDCAKAGEPTEEEAALIERISPGSEVTRITRPVGCPGCNGLGYRGRVAVAEVLSSSATLRQMITAGVTAEELLEQAIKDGFITLAMDGIRHLRNGATSVEELRRVLLSGGD
jgi:type II secretory ATPase GspE/PulE/Tfp pilus assembly ATPase PilB-like protein